MPPGDPAAEPRIGPTNSITDVSGLRVGHHQVIGDGWLTGTTVVLAPGGGAVAGVDCRGGAPGTRETDALDPRNLVDRIHGVVLSGGSAFGLAAADGVVRWLADAGTGFAAGPGIVVPIVPAAVLFDLGRGGSPRACPDASFGIAACEAATGGPVAQGSVGAGTGAVTARGTIKGGIGSASAVLEGTATIGALVAVNAAGSAVDPRTGRLYGAQFGLGSEFAHLRTPEPAEVAAAAGAAAKAAQPFNTTIAVIACDAALTKAQCQKLAGVAHDGFARAIRPVHGMFDGDTVFALATGRGDGVDPHRLETVLAAAADTMSRAVAHAMLAASAAGGAPGYLDVFPSAR
jgi:L-aminopeptidase/D-esterase-like protein